MFFKNSFVLFACVAVCLAVSLNRNKREAYVLPDGVEFFVGNIKTSFACSSSGYYADVDNNCQLFHVCVPQEFPDGKSEIAQYTFACGNQTVFNQFSMTCAHETESIPCASSPDFFYLNERIGQEKALLHEEQDVTKYSSYFSKN